MAKKSKKNKKDVIDNLHKADVKHEKETMKYLKVIEKLYKDAIDELSVLAMKIDGIPLDQHFTFDANKGISKDADEVIRKLSSRITAVTTIGSRNEWLAACEKSDQFIESIAKTSNLTKKTLQGYHDRNLEGLAAFQQRKVNGLELSDRIWKHVAPLKDEVELVTDTSKKYYKHGINSGKSMTKFDRAIGTGMSAQELSQDIRSCLKEPNKLFRRVRDKNGNLQLSKAAKLYHPGQGVYRSSYKNAMRVARSEINMAYRQSDYDRWQKLDWVIGIKIQLSNNHTTRDPKGKGVIPLVDICDELVGNYPKNFKFVGWHPQCRCFVTPIMINYEDLDDDREVIDDDTYKQLPHKDAVTDVPQNFKDYVVNNQERISGWSSVPYYIKDNPQWFDRAIHPEKYIIKALELDDVTKKLLDDFRQYGFNHSGSKLFNKALDEALKAQLAGKKKEFEEAMAKMEAIRKKNEASTASKAKKRLENLEKVVTADDLLKADLQTFTPEQIANIKELEKAIKQKKGLRMNYEQANTGKENPNYELVYKIPSYVKDADGKIMWKNGKPVKNPEHDKAKGYHVNCQTCTVIHELRRRGFNVEAIPNYRGKVWKIYEKNGVGSKHQGYRVGKWLDNDGKPAGPTYAHQYAAQKGTMIKTKEDVTKFFEEYSNGHDGRYEIYVDWKGGSAHVFCAERKNGVWTFFDPQSGKKDVFDNYASKAKLHTFGIIRTDDKLINPKLAESFIAKGELPIVVGKKTRAEEIAEIAQKRHEARTDEQKKKLTDFWAKRKEETKALRQELDDIISAGTGIKEAKDPLKNIDDLITGKKGAITTKSGKTATATMENLRNAAQDIKKVVDEYNSAMSDAKSIVSELKDVKGVDTESVMKAKSIKEIKDGTKALHDVKKQILDLKNIDDPMSAAKDFTIAELKTVDNIIQKNIDDWLKKYNYKSFDDNLEHAKAKLEQEISLTGKSSSKYSTWKVAQDAYKKKLAEVNVKIEWNNVNDKLGEFESISIKTAGFSKKIRQLKQHIADNDILEAKKVLAALEKEKMELEAIAKDMAEIGQYVAGVKKGQIKDLFAKAQSEFMADNLDEVKKLLPQMKQIKEKNESSAASHAKAAQFWKDAKAKLEDVKKKANPDDAEALKKLENAISKKDKKATEEALKEFSKVNTTVQKSETDRLNSKEEKIKHIMNACNVDEATARDFNDAVNGFSYQWDWEIRQVQMGNTSFKSHHGHTIDEIKKRAENCEKFIDAAPKWNGGDTHRGISVSKQQIDEWIKMNGTEAEIGMNGTASWSTSRSVSEGFAGYHIGETDANGNAITEKALFICKDAQYGTSIRHLSNFPNEHEILCSNRCRWKIKGYQKVGNIHEFIMVPIPVS